jgi:hypothetical protein
LTVGLAARGNDGSIFCAADRMMTVGDIEMESPTSKIAVITSSIVILPSDDDAAFHTEIILDVYSTATARITSEPTRWWRVQEIVDLYIQHREDHKSRRSERDILKPLGLDRLSFLAHQHTMDAKLVRQITVDLINYRIPALSVIIAGNDPSGSHIYVVDTNENNNVETGCYTSIGYAAIGAGGRHARAHFLTAGQSWLSPMAETLWNTYLAKKRSEVAPGVGEETDVYMIGPQLGTTVVLNKTVSDKLEEVYKRTKEQEEKARQDASKEMTKYVQELEKVAAEQSKQQAVPSPESAAKESAKPGSGDAAKEG